MRRIINIVAKNYQLVLILMAGILLRFYRFYPYVMFLGDQGRDAIVLKRIVTLEHLPLIGAPTSVGQVYLGPFYYYFIAPWLLLFNYNPVGPAIGVAIFSTFYILLNYLIVKKLVNQKTAIISTLFIALSSVLIEFSRFSWNPNLLPLFTLLTVYFFIESIKTKKWFYYILVGAFLSFTIQLHYLALFLIPVIAFYYIAHIVEIFKVVKKLSIKPFINYLLTLFSFILFSSPLIIFDLRHQFLNTKNFIALFQTSGSSLLTKFKNFYDSFYYLNLHAFNISLNSFLAISLIILLVISLLFINKEKNYIKIFFFFFLSILGFLSFFSGDKHPHYFGMIYPFYFIIIAYFLTSQDSKINKLLCWLFIFGFIILNGIRYPYLSFKGNNQIEQSKKIAKIIISNVAQEKFTVTSLPEKYSDSTYRYFLEIWGKPSIEKDSLTKADELFVVCEQRCDTVIGNPQWDIAYFAPNKIVKEWNVNSVKIYKLIR